MKRGKECPTCGREVGGEEARAWRPFCSERCKLIDLGDWMAGRQGIPADEPAPAEPADEAPTKH